MVRNIRSGTASSSPWYLADVNGTLYFEADNGTAGRELWKSDGTSDGTVLVRDLRSGTANAYLRNLTNVNGTLFFSAYVDTLGNELWKSDGTSEGTVLVRDLSSTTFGSQPWSLTNVNGTLFFTANDGSTGKELWKTDGTSAGTMLVRDIQPGSDGSSSNSLVNVDGTLLFVANDGSTGEDLWQSDGTSSGTVLAMDIATGASSSNPRELREVGGRLFFVATTPDYSTELWTYVEHLPPSDFTLSATSIPENQPSGTAVGTLTTSDPDTGDTFTYTLVPGSGDTNNASFWIDGDTLKTSASFDFEAQSSYSIRMRSSDQRNQWIEETFTITVNNFNEAPTDISLSATSILENQPSGTTVGTLTTAGPDATNICTYKIGRAHV